jgi:MYXO-CTERM domain-containing protein
MFRGVNLRASLVIPAILSALVTLDPAPVQACSCMASTFEDARANSAAIFEGRVESVEPEGERQRRVRFHVTQAWRGVEHERVEIVTANDSAACGYEFVVGEHYLVYAGQAETSLAVSLCSRTARMDDAGEDRQLLGSGTIPVDVEDDTDEPTPREPPATRAGCASCSVTTSEPPILAILLSILSLAFVRRRRSRR